MRYAELTSTINNLGQSAKWEKIEVADLVKPRARFGHTIFCYYNYLIMFGGKSEEGEYLGDLWVFDIVRSSWHMILDNPTAFDIWHN